MDWRAHSSQVRPLVGPWVPAQISTDLPSGLTAAVAFTGSTPAASPLPTPATTREPCRRILGTATSNTRSGILNWHPTGLRISGGSRHGNQ